jgi:hypothetical protein
MSAASRLPDRSCRRPGSAPRGVASRPPRGRGGARSSDLVWPSRPATARWRGDLTPRQCSEPASLSVTVPAKPKHGALTGDFPDAIRRRNRNGALQQEDANNVRKPGTMSTISVPVILNVPADEPRLDLTHLLVFASPQSPARLRSSSTSIRSCWAPISTLWRSGHRSLSLAARTRGAPVVSASGRPEATLARRNQVRGW